MTTPRAFFLRNHSASDLHSAEVSALPTLSTRPSFASKDKFAAWAHDISTEHVFYSLFEPEQPSLRSSASNPIKFMHGIVADYDGAADAINASLPTLKFAPGRAPTWVTKTYSDKARLLWIFERPVPVFSPEVLSLFTKTLARELELRKLLPGLDEGALITNPHTPFELGTDWRQPYGDTRIPNAVVMTHLHDASTRVKWKSDTLDIPIEAVEAEVNKRWPGRWAGPFVDGAKGVRFWDPKADNLTGCTIRPSGAQAWTGEGKFLPWSEILGGEFVKQYRQNRIGGAIDGVYFDGRAYWQKDSEGYWRQHTSEAIKRRLNVTFGLSTESRRGQASEVARAVTTIEDAHHVDGAFPCLFLREDVVRDGPNKFLNVSRATPQIPSPGPGVSWGDGFPWMSRYLDGLFGVDQLPIFLSWLAHFYNNARSGKPKRGHALFIAGPPSAGKTFLSQRVIGGMVGGFGEATDYILGKTNFNEQLFHAPVWTVDDAVAASDPHSHARYSQIVKKVVANPCQEYNAKFKKSVTASFHGRLIVTLNTDEDSVAMLPATDNTILDKLVVLLASSPGVDFSNAEETVTRELPFFSNFVAHYTIPSSLRTNPDETTRYGFDAFFHPELLTTAHEASSSRGLYELLNKWRRHYFRRHDKPDWQGTATDLINELQQDELLKEVSRTVTRGDRSFVGKNLRKLVKERTSWLSATRTATDRIYIIARPEAGQDRAAA